MAVEKSLPCKLFGWLFKGSCRDEFAEYDVRDITKQFYTTLQGYFTRIEDRGHRGEDSVPSGNSKAFARVKALLKQADDDEPTWQDAYDIEQQMVHLYDGHMLQIEIERRLLDAKHSLQPDVAEWYRSKVKPETNEDELRTLLSRLINDLQWRYSLNQARRRFLKQMTRRTEVIFLVSVVSFFSLITILFIEQSSAPASQDAALWNWGLPLFVCLTGAFGAAFSMMISLRTRIADSTFEDLKLTRSWGMLLARVLVGIGAGFVVFYMIRSGLLAGQAFPSFADVPPLPGDSQAPAEAAIGEASPLLKKPELAKLFIWCFLAGFSEKLVPNLLSSAEKRLEAFDRGPALAGPLGGGRPPPKPGAATASVDATAPSEEAKPDAATASVDATAPSEEAKPGAATASVDATAPSEETKSADETSSTRRSR